jgi:Leucine-rich repeat (LRR) protein
MRNINHIIILSALAVATGCSVEEQQPVNEIEAQEAQVVEKEITIQAICEDSGSKTKTVLDEDNGVILWTPGDALSVFYGSGTDGGSKFTSNATEAVATTTFTGKITTGTGDDGTYYYGVYPYSEDISCDGSTVTITLPSLQEAVPGTFANGLFPAVGRSEGLTMSFFNVCGGWRFSLTYEGVRKVTLKSNNGELITGKVKIGFDAKGKPEIKEITDGSDEVVLEAPSGQSFEPDKYYYMALLPTVFNSGFTMTFETYTETGTYNRTAKTTISRSKISGITHLDDYLTEGFEPKTGGIPIEDEDFKQYLVSEEQNFDTDEDGEISYEEAAAIEELEINTLEIESLTGIEYMTGLRTLICTGEATTRASGGIGKLTSLDVSNNKELEYLDCSYNQITSLDISNNLNLTYLDCSPMDNETGVNLLAELYVLPGQIVDGVTVDRSDEYVPEETEIIYVGDVVGPSDFPDENFRAYVFENFDTDQDGVLSDEECFNVKEITVNTDNIESLQGIEHFTNLSDLTCSGNQLTSLDISNNAMLYSLNCSGNQLTSLDISNNTNLSTLNCSNNHLTSLEASGLNSLNCRGNKLTSLDISNNNDLSTLDCSGNQLTSLDISNNTNLSTLNCSNNQLTSLDISNNAMLYSLNCSNNHLTSLKASGLNSLNCSGNQLTSLDISNSTNLQSISCENNHLTSLDISNNLVLTNLNCKSNKLTSLNVSNNTELKSLFCDNNLLKDLDIIQNRALKELTCAPMNDAGGNNLLTTLHVSPLQFIQNITVDRNDSFIPTRTVIVFDPHVHLLSSYGDFIINYWTDNYGATFYNVNVPNVDEDQPDNCVFKNDINASFVTYPQPSDTSSIEDLVAANSGNLHVNYLNSVTYYFDKNRMEAITRIGDKNVRFRVSEDGVSLYASILDQSDNVLVAEERIAGISNYMYIIGDENKRFPVWNRFTYVKGGEVSGQLINTGDMYVYISGNVTLESGLVCPITYDGMDSFRANILRPVSISTKSRKGFVDGVDSGEEGSYITYKYLIDPFDWRQRYFISKYPYYWGYYGPFKTSVDVNSAECDLNGVRQPLPATISLSYSDGVLTYKNNSVAITTDYSIFVKVTVTYGFGVLSDWIKIPVTPKNDQEND